MQGKLNKKNLIVLISILVLAIVAICGIGIIFVLNYNGFAPEHPFILDDGQNVFITSKANENYQGYKFKFSSRGKDIIVESDVNYLSAKEIVEKGGEIGQTYKVSVSYISEREGQATHYSKPLSWTLFDYLDCASVNYDQDDGRLTWESIEHADYYKVYFNSSLSEFIEVEENYIDVKRIGGGERTICVLPFSNSGYKTPNVTKPQNFTLINYLSGFNQIDFDADKKIITATAEEEYATILIILNDKTYEKKSFNVSPTDENYIYKIDISDIYIDETQIGIKPKAIDKYNLSENNEIYYFISTKQ